MSTYCPNDLFRRDNQEESHNKEDSISVNKQYIGNIQEEGGKTEPGKIEYTDTTSNVILPQNDDKKKTEDNPAEKKIEYEEVTEELIITKKDEKDDKQVVEVPKNSIHHVSHHGSTRNCQYHNCSRSPSSRRICNQCLLDPTASNENRRP